MILVRTECLGDLVEKKTRQFADDEEKDGLLRDIINGKREMKDVTEG